MNPSASPSPFFPLLLQLMSQIIDFILLHFVCDGHMGCESSVFFVYQLWELPHNLVIDVLQLVSIGFWINKANSMRETGNLLKC